MSSLPALEVESPKRFRSGVAFAIVGTFMFALKSIFIKFAFAEGTDATTLLALRMGLACPFYIGMLIYLQRTSPEGASEVSVSTSDRRSPTTHEKAFRVPLATAAYAASLGFLGYYLASYLDMSGLELISAQLERLTLFTYPAMIAVLAWLFLGEEMNGKIIFAITFCYAGIFLMYSRERNIMVGSNITMGVLLVVGSALSYSLYVLFAKPVMQRVGSRTFTSFAMLGSTAFVAAHFIATQSIREVSIPLMVWIYAMIIAFVCTVIPSFLINEAILRLGASRTTIIGSVGPVITMALAIFVLKEPSSVYHLIGMALVIFGVSLVARRRK